jgi:hypothetical protein
MLRSLGAERLRLDREIRRLEKIVGEPDKLSVSYPPPSYELLKRLQIRGDCVTTGDDTKITTRILR